MIDCKKGQLPGWMVGFVLLFALVLLLSYSAQDASPDTPEKTSGFAEMFNSVWFWIIIVVLVIAIPVLILRPLSGS